MSLNELSKTEFFVSNRNRKFNESPLEFTCALPYVSENGPNSYYLRIDSVTIENLFPVIRQGVNDTLYYKYNGVSSYFQFQEGNYDIYSLLNSVQASLQSLNAGFILTFDTQQLKLSLFIPAGVTFSLIRSTKFADFPMNWAFPESTERFLEVLGWTFQYGNENAFVGGAGGYTYVPVNQVKCRGSSYYELCTDAPVSQSYNNGTNYALKILQRVYMNDVPFGNIVSIRSQIDQPFGIDLSNVSSLKFFLVDEWNQRVTVPIGVNILLALRFSLCQAQI